MEKLNSYTSNFKTFLLYLGKLLLIVGVLAWSLSYAFEKIIVLGSESSGSFKIDRLIKNTDQQEVAIIGSSRANQNYVPSILGENFFNYGINGTQSNIWIKLLEIELSKNKTTPVIINLDLSGLIYSSGSINNYLPHYSLFKNCLKEKETNWKYNFPIIKYHGRVESYSKYYLSMKFNSSEIVDQGGVFDKKKVSKKEFEKSLKKRAHKKSEFRLEPKLLRQLKNTIKGTNRDLIFVIAPYHEAYYSKFKGLQLKQQFISELTSDNIIFLDYSTRNWEKEYFKDATHFNYKGAKKWSLMLKKDIKKYL